MHRAYTNFKPGVIYKFSNTPLIFTMEVYWKIYIIVSALVIMVADGVE